MAKVITFSRTFPAYHPKAGQPTYFVEAFYKSLYEFGGVPVLLENFNHDIRSTGFSKHHTIREGHRFKKGDFFSPRVWGTNINPKSGRSGPYHSKQIRLAPDTEILEVWDIIIDQFKNIHIRGNEFILSQKEEEILANNDGLSFNDFFQWFDKVPFEGQIICWKENIKY